VPDENVENRRSDAVQRSGAEVRRSTDEPVEERDLPDVSQGERPRTQVQAFHSTQAEVKAQYARAQSLAKSDSVADPPTADTRRLTPEQEKSLRSLQERMAEHEEKLADYLADPDAYDNKGFLKNAPTPEIRQSIIDGRAAHLRKEIDTFQRQIDELSS